MYAFPMVPRVNSFAWFACDATIFCNLFFNLNDFFLKRNQFFADFDYLYRKIALFAIFYNLSLSKATETAYRLSKRLVVLMPKNVAEIIDANFSHLL